MINSLFQRVLARLPTPQTKSAMTSSFQSSSPLVRHQPISNISTPRLDVRTKMADQSIEDEDEDDDELLINDASFDQCSAGVDIAGIPTNPTELDINQMVIDSGNNRRLFVRRLARAVYGSIDDYRKPLREHSPHRKSMIKREVLRRYPPVIVQGETVKTVLRQCKKALDAQSRHYRMLSVAGRCFGYNAMTKQFQVLPEEKTAKQRKVKSNAKTDIKKRTTVTDEQTIDSGVPKSNEPD